MAIKLQHTPKIIGFLAPKRSKIKPPTGANTAPTMAPGSKTTPASVADCFKTICTNVGNNKPYPNVVICRNIIAKV